MFLEYSPNILALTPLSETPNPPAILLAKTMLFEHYIFSISNSTQSGNTGRKHSLVYLLCSGAFQCIACATQSQCVHKQRAAENATHAGIIDSEGSLASDIPEAMQELDDIGDVSASEKQAVSFWPIPVPQWCQLPQDTLSYSEQPPEVPPIFIPLEGSCWCCCGAEIGDDYSNIFTVTQKTVHMFRTFFKDHFITQNTIHLYKDAWCTFCTIHLWLSDAD